MINESSIIGIHSLLEKSGACLKGIRSIHLLKSAIAGQQWYDTKILQILHVSYSICANHVFVDGNKRTSFLAIMYNMPSINENQRDRIAYNILELAKGNLTKEQYFNNILYILGYNI